MDELKQRLKREIAELEQIIKDGEKYAGDDFIDELQAINRELLDLKRAQLNELENHTEELKQCD